MDNSSTIQVDMFEVQLGAALLLQCRTPDDDTVRVLADGGQGPPTDIQQRLIAAMEGFGDGQRHIDLRCGHSL